MKNAGGIFDLSGHHSLFTVRVQFPQVLGIRSVSFFFGFLRNENAEFTQSLLCSLFTIHYPNSQANGLLITPITFTCSPQSHE